MNIYQRTSAFMRRELGINFHPANTDVPVEMALFTCTYRFYLIFIDPFNAICTSPLAILGDPVDLAAAERRTGMAVKKLLVRSGAIRLNSLNAKCGLRRAG